MKATPLSSTLLFLPSRPPFFSFFVRLPSDKEIFIASRLKKCFSLFNVRRNKHSFHSRLGCINTEFSSDKLGLCPGLNRENSVGALSVGFFSLFKKKIHFTATIASEFCVGGERGRGPFSGE